MSRREELIDELIRVQNDAFNVMTAYDSQFHRYGEIILYEAEADILELIGSHPGITATEIANILQRTSSACSQVVHKLMDKGWVEQKRNPNNNRICNLTLTDEGLVLYEDYKRTQWEDWQRVINSLPDFTEEELENHLRIQKMLNKVYRRNTDLARERSYNK